MKNKIKLTNCGVCSYSYEQYILDTRGHPLEWQNIAQDCPKCGYNPEFEKQIRELIEQKISASISSDGKIRFNSRELADIVNKEIKEIWPKHEK